jgi:hypothetical protein
VEKAIVKALKFTVNNPRFKASDLQEWSTSRETVEKNLQRETESLVELPLYGVFTAILKTADKR